MCGKDFLLPSFCTSLSLGLILASLIGGPNIPWYSQSTDLIVAGGSVYADLHQLCAEGSTAGGSSAAGCVDINPDGAPSTTPSCTRSITCDTVYAVQLASYLGNVFVILAAAAGGGFLGLVFLRYAHSRFFPESANRPGGSSLSSLLFNLARLASGLLWVGCVVSTSAYIGLLARAANNTSLISLSHLATGFWLMCAASLLSCCICCDVVRKEPPTANVITTTTIITNPNPLAVTVVNSGQIQQQPYPMTSPVVANPLQIQVQDAFPSPMQSPASSAPLTSHDIRRAAAVAEMSRPGLASFPATPQPSPVTPGGATGGFDLPPGCKIVVVNGKMMLELPSVQSPVQPASAASASDASSAATSAAAGGELPGQAQATVVVANAAHDMDIAAKE